MRCLVFHSCVTNPLTRLIQFYGTDFALNVSFVIQAPAVIVLISAAIRWEDYGTESNCQLSTRHGTIWAFIAPMIFVVTINIVVFAMVMQAIFSTRQQLKQKASRRSREATTYSELKKGLRASLSFLCLLGMTYFYFIMFN